MTCYSPRTYRIRKERFAMSSEDDLSDKITLLESIGFEDFCKKENNVHKNIFDMYMCQLNNSSKFESFRFLRQ